jgi:adenosylcobinamide-phosphate synthase
MLLVGGSGAVGWAVERLALGMSAGVASTLPLLVIALASALAGRSLAQAVRAVLAALAAGELPLARQRLSWIVGRDTEGLEAPDILRAAAETASENAVDGLFAPLFWMLLGAALWSGGCTQAPGPLALAWGFKAASTLDSMLGYRRGRLRWLGTAGARLDDLLVWLPCRLVLLSLPLAAGMGPRACWHAAAAARRDGANDPSPNAGRSQAIYAHCLGVQLGGLNHYQGQARPKPLLAMGGRAADAAAVERMLQLSGRLALIWQLGAGLLMAALPRVLPAQG